MHDHRAREGGWQPAALARLFIGCLIVLGSACGGHAPILESGSDSKEALAQAVVDALAAGDGEALTALAITESEFRTGIWPRLPASQPEMGMPADYVWIDTSTKSRGHLARALVTRAGREATVEAVTFKGPTTDYQGLIVHRETELTLRGTSGDVTRERLFGSMVEAGGRWKVYSYVVD